ncbi:hypothetical protein SMU81_00755 [Streptococcus mutans SF14]|nr:hypothetical protein SMU81_00755 [Streptococcus mutans SF14]
MTVKVYICVNADGLQFLKSLWKVKSLDRLKRR